MASEHQHSDHPHDTGGHVRSPAGRTTRQGHAHHHGGPSGRPNKRRLALVLGLTALFMVVEAAAGIYTHSLALLADAAHMLTDAGGLALALFAIWFAEKPATPERTYGFYRAEILAALANAVVLCGICALILTEAYQRFRVPPVVESKPMLVVAIIGLLFNVVGLALLRSGSSDSLNMKGAYYELLSDALSSVGVLIAAAVMWATGWYYADPLLSAAIGLFIIPRTWGLLSESVGILLEGTPSDVNLAQLRESLLKLPGVAAVHDLHVWVLTSGNYAMSLHAVLQEGADLDAVRRAICEHARTEFKIGHVTVQAERDGCLPADTHL